MNIKRRHVIIGLVILAIVWAGNIYYYNMHVLKRPLFIKHYYDIKNGMHEFKLFYIENINEKKEVSYVAFPEVEVGYLDTNIFNYNSDNRYYRMKVIQVRIPRSNDGTVPENIKNRVITKIQAYTMDGKIYDEDIGRIYLDWDMPEEPVLSSISSSSKSTGSGYTTASAMLKCSSDMKIYSVTSRFSELLEDILDVSINKTPLRDIKFPIELKKGDTITVDYSFVFGKGDINGNNAYECTIDLLTEDEFGKKGIAPVYISYWKLSPRDYDITAMRRDRGEY